MNYKVIDKETYYKKGMYDRFTKECKCSSSMTARIDVTKLYEVSKKSNTKFYINFLYILSKVLNSKDDYKLNYLWESEELICYDQINPTQYIFHEEDETCTPVYTTYYEDYNKFYNEALKDIEEGKKIKGSKFESNEHPNWFDASYISFVSYDSLNVELPDGYFYFLPIINWGKYREENGKFMMPVTVRMNHATADGFCISRVFKMLEDEIEKFNL